MKALCLRLRSHVFFLLFLALPVLTFALQPPNDNSDLRQKQFSLPELYISSAAVSYTDIAGLLSNRSNIDAFIARYGWGTVMYIDPRSGFPMSIITPIPLIPGQGNRLTMTDLSLQLGREVGKVDEKVVAELFSKYLHENKEALGIDMNQLGPVKAAQVNDRLWHISIPQEVNGIPVRWSSYVAAINSGNIVLQGAVTWGNVKINTRPALSSHQAIEAGFQYVGGQRSNDAFWKKPELEIIPIAPAEFSMGEGLSGPPGSGYGHRLAWVFGFLRAPEHPRWEVFVDAHTGQILAMQDTNHYFDQKIQGGAYPLTNTEVCPSADRCGELQPNTPMPFVNTGLPAPNDFTNSAGTFDYTGGTVTTTLDGPYVTMNDACGSFSESASGGITLGGTNGEHDCAVPPGTSPGNTAATRSGAYEVNKIFETARGYLPGNPWLNGNENGPLPTNMNINLQCNAFYSEGNPGSLNFYRNLGNCRNTGEIAAVFDHEWGHGLDDHDSGGALSNSSEGYADIASMYRLWASCIGYGFVLTEGVCGATSDGTGFNTNESQTDPPVCDLDCSGVRDADYLKIAPQTPLGVSFVCSSCRMDLFFPGPCGRQRHCAATPTREAAWNFVARELQNSPGTNVDANTAFIIADRTFYLGSGNVFRWHNCACPSTSDGCNADGGYLNWLAADDDNGNLNDGTPHMTDLFAAFNTNGIACAEPAPVDSGCAGGPSTAPVLAGSPGNNKEASLSWNAVAGATQYNVYRTEGHAGCNFGKTLIGSTAGTSFTDTEVANERPYSYIVMAEGANDACFSPASNCVTVTPCLFCDDFEDGGLDLNWTYTKNVTFWSESGGSLISTSNREATAIASPAFGGCTNCYFETTMQTTGGSANRVSSLFHYIDKDNHVEVLMQERQDRWVIKQKIGKTVVAKAKVEQPILPNTAYTVRISFTGTEYQVSVDGVQILTLIPAVVPTGGTVGMRVQGATGTFGYVEVN